MKQVPKRSVWLDLAKMVAIFAVMLDHVRGALYSNPRISTISFFCVSLFMITMGCASSWSLRKGGGWNLRDKCLRMVGPYLMATFVYCLLQGCFDLELYLTHVVRFNADGTFYYVLIYLQFLFIVPILALFTRCSGWRAVGLEITGLLTVLGIAWFTTNHSNVLRIFGGGGKLLGGTFIIPLYLGVLLGKYTMNRRLRLLPACVVSLVFCVLAVVWWRFVVSQPVRLRFDTHFPFASLLNPPNVSLIIYACLVAGATFGLGNLLDQASCERSSRFARGVTWLGKHTLYLFLYHRFYLYMLRKVPCIHAMGHTLTKWVIYFSVMILGALLFELIMKLLKRAVAAAYCGKSSGEEESGQTFTENGAAAK